MFVLLDGCSMTVLFLFLCGDLPAIITFCEALVIAVYSPLEAPSVVAYLLKKLASSTTTF